MKKLLLTFLILIIVISALSAIIPADAASKISRIARIAYRTGKINARHGIDAPLEDFPFFAGHPYRIRIGYAVNVGIRKFWNDMYSGISANCPQLDEAAELFPIDNQDMLCYGLQMLRTFSKIDFAIRADGSFKIEGCIPSMGCE